MPQDASIKAKNQLVVVERRAKKGEVLQAIEIGDDFILCPDNIVEDFIIVCSESDNQVPNVKLCPGDQVLLQESCDLINHYHLDGINGAEVVQGQNGLSLMFPDYPDMDPLPLGCLVRCRKISAKTTITILKVVEDYGSRYEGC